MVTKNRTVLGIFLVLASIVTLSAQGYSLLVPAQVTVSTAGTSVQVTSDSRHKSCSAVYIEADEDNAGVLYIGESNVSSSRYSSALAAGEGWSWEMRRSEWLDARTLYLDADTNTTVASVSLTCAP